jgi:hypothetical protein
MYIGNSKGLVIGFDSLLNRDVDIFVVIDVIVIFDPFVAIWPVIDDYTNRRRNANNAVDKSA